MTPLNTLEYTSHDLHWNRLHNNKANSTLGFICLSINVSNPEVKQRTHKSLVCTVLEYSQNSLGSVHFWRNHEAWVSLATRSTIHSTQLSRELWRRCLGAVSCSLDVVGLSPHRHYILSQANNMTSSDRFPVPVRSAAKSHCTDWCCQNLSERALNAVTVQTSATELGWLLALCGPPQISLRPSRANRLHPQNNGGILNVPLL